MLLSCVITAKDKDDPNLKVLFASIDRQDFPKEELEILVMTEGTSESAKAMGIKKAKGEYVCILASDNELVDTQLFSSLTSLLEAFPKAVGAFPRYYYCQKKDPILNRYFALFGFNDPLPFYLGKADRLPHYELLHILFDVIWYCDGIPTLGDNCCVIRRNKLFHSDLTHYYHIDNCEDLRRQGENIWIRTAHDIWHKTGQNWWQLLKRRYKYALELGFNKDRRWKMIDGAKDIWLTVLFIIYALTVIQPLYLSVKGYIVSKEKDIAWFLHPLWCVITVILYGLLTVHLEYRKLVLSSVLLGKSLYKSALSLWTPKPIRSLK